MYDCTGKTVKSKQVAVCHHPTNAFVSELLLKKQADLKKVVADSAVNITGVDQRSNAQLRRAIRQHFEPLTFADTEIPLDGSEDTKEIFKQLKNHFPQYALFRADRASQDADAEVQDPLKVAITQALKELQNELNHVETQVQAKVIDVANRTLEKLKEIDQTLGNELTPEFKADRKWDKVFSFELTGDHGIPINKRGSGVRRLILLSFFRAEAERLRRATNLSDLIYAIEEPETSQNPHNQRLLVEALLELSDQPGVQVLLTTHTPGIAGLIPKDCLRYVQHSAEKCAVVSSGSDEVYLKIAQELGVTADKRLQLLICVEGPSDVEYLKHFSQILHKSDSTIVDLASDPRVAIFPVGGSNLEQWVKNHYLRGLGIPEFHLYDRGTANPPKYQTQIDTVNQRVGHRGLLTNKPEIENYLHSDAIRLGLGVTVTVDNVADVPILVAQATRAQDSTATPWAELSEAKVKECEKRAKGHLQNIALPHMTLSLLSARDPGSEVRTWLTDISGRLM